MTVSILRIKQICALLGVGKTKLDEDFVYKSGRPEYVPDTDNSVRRLRLVNSENVARRHFPMKSRRWSSSCALSAMRSTPAPSAK
jgi:hypothetical protein